MSDDGMPPEPQRAVPGACATCPAAHALRESQRETQLLLETLDHVAEPVALVDASGRVVRANRAALTALRHHRGVWIAADARLTTGSAAARSLLAQALAICARAAADPDPRRPRPVERIVVSRVGALPVVITLQPLLHGQADASAAVAIVFIGDPDTPQSDLAALRFTYGLSPAETRLVRALSEGGSLREIATRLDLTYETVRSYLKRVLAKTGARGQSDLIRLTRGLR